MLGLGLCDCFGMAPVALRFDGLSFCISRRDGYKDFWGVLTLVIEMSAELSFGVDMSGYLMSELELSSYFSSQLILGTLTLVGKFSSSLVCLVVEEVGFRSSSFLLIATMIASLIASSSFRCLSCVCILDIMEVMVSAWCWLKKLNLDEIVAV